MIRSHSLIWYSIYELIQTCLLNKKYAAEQGIHILEINGCASLLYMYLSRFWLLLMLGQASKCLLSPTNSLLSALAHLMFLRGNNNIYISLLTNYKNSTILRFFANLFKPFYCSTSPAINWGLPQERTPHSLNLNPT